MLAKHCLQEFKLDCQLRRLTDRTIKGYYNNTLNFLNYAEKHHDVVEVEEIRTVHIKHYVQYLLSKKLTAACINNILKCRVPTFASPSSRNTSTAIQPGKLRCTKTQGIDKDLP